MTQSRSVMCAAIGRTAVAHTSDGGQRSSRALMETDAPAILIVDDNEDNRYTLQLLLESDGHSRLATASGGHEALALRRSLQGLKAVTGIQGKYSPQAA